ASMLQNERFMDASDAHEFYVCEHCGTIGYYNFEKKIPVCPLCGGNDLSLVRMPHAFKLLVYEMMSMGVKVQFKLTSEWK
ncbi:MAG: DNA-directed RNA polymerase subunit B, partial [Candidatus Korarchaeota archaeon]